jgi:hypothetical protein
VFDQTDSALFRYQTNCEMLRRLAPVPFVQAITLTRLALETFLKTAIKNILLSMRRFVSVFRLSV